MKIAGKVSFDDAVCIQETRLAILVCVDGKQAWIPQSHVDDDSEVWKKGDSGTLVISEWAAIKNGLV